MKASELRSIVNLLSPCLGDASVIPALSYLCFDKAGVYAYNDVVATRRNWKHGLGSFGVPGKGLSTLLAKWGDRELDLSTVKDNGLLRFAIKSGKSLTKLPALPISSFVFEEPKMQGVIGKITELTRLQETLETVADSSVNPVHKSVVLAVKKGENVIMAYSSNGPAMTHAKVGRLGIPSREDRHWIVPKLAIQQMITISQGEIKLYMGKQGVIARSGQDSVITKLFEGTPPDFHKPLTMGETQAVIKKWKGNKQLEDALSTASIIYNESDAMCFFSLEDGTMQLQVKSTLGSEFKSKVRIEGLDKGKLLDFHANPNAMLTAFSHNSLTKDSKLVLQDRAALFGDTKDFLYACAFSILPNQAPVVLKEHKKGLKIRKETRHDEDDDEIPF